MRLAGRIKMGYYPTPPRVVAMISTWLGSSEPLAALDPCCGEGRALADLLQRRSGAAGYGVELDRSRAFEARKRLKKVLHTDAFFIRASHEAFSLLWLNPPYDTGEAEDGRRERLEVRFLREMHVYLKPGGVLVYIIPEEQLNLKVAKMLAYRFFDLRTFRFPEPEFGDYGQVVVLGVKKPAPAAEPDVAEALARAAQEGTLPPLEPVPAPVYSVPQSDPEVRLFRGQVLTEEDVLSALKDSRLWDRVRDATGGNSVGLRVETPPVSLHTGHLGLLLAAGFLDGVVGSGENRHLVRGRVVKEQVQVSVSEEGDDGSVKEEMILRDVYRVQITLLGADGEAKALM